MTANRRIFLNIVATYGRSLYALAVGLFCGRWTLMALGQVDYGLMGLVGGLIGFVTFLNGLMAGAVSRFYAFAVGEAQQADNPEKGLENCRRWFNVALFVHTFLPIVLVAIGYPIGIWAIEHYLTIPSDRVFDCIWVWRFTCISALIGMVNVPFAAMYQAKQEIAELTIYGFVTTTLNAGFLFYMIRHPGVWLVKFSAWSCCLGAAPALLICVLSFVHFRECRIRVSYLWDVSRMKSLFIFAGGRFICALSQMFSHQGMVVAVNKVLGPVRNAAMSVGTAVVGHASNLSSSCLGAFSPAISNAAGSGDDARMRALAYRACKIATFAMMIFAVPLIVEVDNVLILWLKNPPEGSATMCGLILVANVIDHLTDGYWMSIFAKGRVTLFNACESVGFFLGFGSAVVLMKLGLDIASVGCGYGLAYFYAMIVKLILGRRYCDLSFSHWFRRVCFPLVMTAICSLCAGLWTRFVLPPTFLRVLLTTACSEVVLIGLAWNLVLDVEEKGFVLAQLRSKIGRFLCHNS